MTVVDGFSIAIVLATLAAIPSTSVALVVTRSATLGLKQGIATAIGIVLGDLIFALLAILGLTALAEVMGGLFLLIRYAAGIYLIWFGIGLIRHRHSIAIAPTAAPIGNWLTSAIAGLIVTLGDVKAIFFYASLFPAFIDLASLSPAEVVSLLSLIGLTVGGVKLLYALAAQRLAAIATTSPLVKPAKLAAGGLMIGAGTYLIAKQ